MWWLPPNFSDGAEFEFGCSVHSPDGVTERAESIHPYNSPPLVRLNEWRCRIVVAWCWLADGLLV